MGKNQLFHRGPGPWLFMAHRDVIPIRSRGRWFAAPSWAPSWPMTCWVGMPRAAATGGRSACFFSSNNKMQEFQLCKKKELTWTAWTSWSLSLCENVFFPAGIGPWNMMKYEDIIYLSRLCFKKVSYLCSFIAAANQSWKISIHGRPK